MPKFGPLVGSDAALNDKKDDSVEASKFINGLKDLLDLFNLGGCSKDLLLLGIDANQVDGRHTNQAPIEMLGACVCVCATFA